MDQVKPLVSRMRFQLLGGLFFSIIFPLFLRFGNDPAHFATSSVYYTLVGSSASILFGYFIMRRMADFPGVEAGWYIVLSFSIAFALTIGLFFMFRFEYSRFLFAASFLLCLIWFLAVHFTVRNVIRTKLAIVKGGNWKPLLNLHSIDWSVLRDPNEYKDEMGAIVADLRHMRKDKWEVFLSDKVLAGIPVYHTKQVQETISGKVSIEHLSENSLGSLLPNTAYLRLKFLTDWCLALLGLPIVMTVYIALFSLNLSINPGPVVFKQRRIGYRGKEFTVYKFRTMNPITPSGGSAVSDLITSKDDQRITSIGHYLRKYRVDELPQIVNILKGEMSWIGPRPEAIALSDWYQGELPHYKYRHIVRPGISGWAQVNQGHVTTPDKVLEKLHYDFFYIKYFSPWLDMLIVLKTIQTVSSGFGAK